MRIATWSCPTCHRQQRYQLPFLAVVLGAAAYWLLGYCASGGAGR